MRKSVHLLRTLVALGIAMGYATIALGQGRPPIVGGYSEVAKDKPEVVAAAEFAVSARKEQAGGPLSLVLIKRAQRQMVAGTNYKLCLEVKPADETDAGVEAQDVEAVVFEKLPRASGDKYKLTSWEEKDCGGSDSEENHGASPGKE